MGGIISSNRIRPVEARPLTAKQQYINDNLRRQPFREVAPEPVFDIDTGRIAHGGHQLRLASVVPINSRNNNRR